LSLRLSLRLRWLPRSFAAGGATSALTICALVVEQLAQALQLENQGFTLWPHAIIVVPTPRGLIIFHGSHG